MRLKTSLIVLLMLIGLPTLAARFAYITNQRSHDLLGIDMRSQTVVDTLPAGAGLVGIDARVDGLSLFVSNWYLDRLMRFSTQRRASPSLEINMGNAPAGVPSVPLSARRPTLEIPSTLLKETLDDSTLAAKLRLV